jgi:hypothetical protein
MHGGREPSACLVDEAAVRKPGGFFVIGFGQ